ncbi:hypothetical protein EVAR_5694_1 [Eumeta japonica]|uniref:Uncharacterized protein n=1 Tax=Eumeta variegata TaxID=151549 RepID=A0A4C1T8B6_EUMVA|nr:hypothetical protein EVAR_5694_1 [Eumeta japonica]
MEFTSLLHEPAVSQATGIKRNMSFRMLYFRYLRLGANSAPEAAARQVLFRWDAANLLIHVSSQIILRPLCQRINVNLSGRLPPEQWADTSNVGREQRLQDDLIEGILIGESSRASLTTEFMIAISVYD